MAKVTVHEAINTEVRTKPVENKTTTDALGRTITIRKLNPMQQGRVVMAVGSDISKNDTYMVGFALPAAMVVSIDDAMFPIPENMAQIEAVLTELGDEGMDAIGKLLFSSVIGNVDADTTKEAAKN